MSNLDEYGTMCHEVQSNGFHIHNYTTENCQIVSHIPY